MNPSEEALRARLERLKLQIIKEEGDIWTIKDSRHQDKVTLIKVKPYSHGSKKEASYEIIE
jgi:hypothetical protein